MGTESSAVVSPRLVSLAEIEEAAQRIRGVAVHTPLVRLDGSPGRTMHLKAESLQPIGSFKLRGAYNKVAQLSADERRRGVITYSSGNHAQGVAYAARALGCKAVIAMPSSAPQVKRDATAALGAEIVLVGPASTERKARAEALASEHGYTMIPPYDDLAIIAGQGTCGLEILEDLPDVDLVLAPVSGGGLLSGIAAAIKQSRPEVRVYGVEPELAADAAESLRTGRLATWSAEQTTRTLADGLRTQRLGELNFAHLRRFLDGIVTVSEDDILAAMRRILFGARLVSEPSGAAAPAALLFRAEELPPFRQAVAVLSGGNVEAAVLRQILG
jgi:threonine dehydratase